jgi:hypothetical protein
VAWSQIRLLVLDLKKLLQTGNASGYQSRGDQG